jgi:transposase
MPIETMAKKKPRARRSFTPEFKADIVAACRRGDRSLGQVARDFDLTETAVRAWMKQAEIDEAAAGAAAGGVGGSGPLTSDERAELARLRRENRRLAEDVAILTKAPSFLRSGGVIEAVAGSAFWAPPYYERRRVGVPLWP